MVLKIQDLVSVPAQLLEERQRGGRCEQEKRAWKSYQG